MQFETSILDSGVLRVTVGGRLDMDTTAKLESSFASQVASRRAPVVVDISAVEFIASIAMRMLLRNAKAQQTRGGKLVLYKPTPLVREALTMAGMGNLIPMHDDFESACRDALAGTAG